MIHRRTLASLEFDKIIDKLADYCASEPGKTLARAVTPLGDVDTANRTLKLYEETSLWASTSPQYIPGAFPDISSLTKLVKSKRLASGLAPSFALDQESLWGLRETLRMAQKAMESIQQPEAGKNWPALLEFAAEYPFPLQLLAALNRCINDDGLIKDESSPELFQLRTELRRLHQACMRKVREFAQQYNILSYLQDEFMTLASDRYVLPLKANFKGKLQGIIHDWSQTGETCYFEPYFLVEINNRLQELKHEEREEERKILQYLTNLLDSDLVDVEGVCNFLAQLDLQLAKRKLASALSAEVITFTSSDDGIELLSARHPILVLAREKQEKANPVRPLDIILRPGERALIITGGNAGGKTVCLKTLGLLSIMAMSGLPVPADRGSHIPWFERIDAFIGDEQSLAENVSTFSAQIDHLGKAYKHLDKNALALLDEFGAGTDPAEGAALAQATHDDLLEKQCMVLSATHFPALKAYAMTKPGARAASMLFDPTTGKPLFKLAYDQVGSSQALAVAAEHGLPESILARARQYLLQTGSDASELLDKLNRLAAQREEEITNLRNQQSKDATQTRMKLEKLDAERSRLQTTIQDKIRELMDAWRKNKSSAKTTLREMSGLRQELGLAKETASVLPQLSDYAIGQKVFHTGFNKPGIVIGVDEKKNRARIDLNGVNVWAPLKDLRMSGESLVNASKRAPAATVNAAPVYTLDVRGQRAAEAIGEVEKFLDKAILAGSSEIEIIHGRGTGALRREIHNYLRSFPHVSSLELAPEDRGGDGMTIVTMK